MKKLNYSAIVNATEKLFDNSEVENFDSEHDEFYTTEQAASFLKVSKKRILNLASSGKLPFYKLFNSNRYRKSELLKLILSNKKGVSR